MMRTDSGSHSRFLVAFLVLLLVGFSGTTQPVQAQEQSTAEEREAGWITVRPGDTLFSISRRYDVSVDDLRSWNDLSDSGIRSGMRLRIAPLLEPEQSADDDDIDPRQDVPSGQDSDPQEPAGAPADSMATASAEVGSVTPLGAGMVAVTIGPGETLYSLANRFGLRPDSLSSLNPGLPTALDYGMLIIVPQDRVTRVITVRRGDTLFSIAREEGVTINQLREVNDLDGSDIGVGQRLRVPASSMDSESAVHLPDVGQFSMQPYPEALIGRTLSQGRALRSDGFLLGHPSLPAGSIVLVTSADGRHAFAEVVEHAPERRPVFIEGSQALMEALALNPGDTVSLFRVR